jgi:hypothetical protein
VNFRVVKLEAFSGAQATIYSVILEEDEANGKTLFEHFVTENSKKHHEEVKDIASRLVTIGKKTGARDIFFKDWEGKPGDGVCALFDNPDKHLRLYCIRFGKGILVVGGGGQKPKAMKAFQESEKLTKENDYMRIVSREIEMKIKARDLTFAPDGTELFGDFKFYNND